ncbi:MAG: hypothetical protein WCD47_15120 [Candidatus Sulfotelmatobacter sp.]
MTIRIQSKWPAAIIGMANIIIGVVWLAVWIHFAHGPGSVDWMAYELPPPLGARLMILAGLLILIATGVWGPIGKLAKKSASK